MQARARAWVQGNQGAAATSPPPPTRRKGQGDSSRPRVSVWWVARAVGDRDRCAAWWEGTRPGALSLGLCLFPVWQRGGELGSPGSCTQLPVQAPGLPVRSPGFT